MANGSTGTGTGTGIVSRMLLFHADDSFFAEYDIVRPHPGNPRLFVEAVEAWGRGQDIRRDARMMPMPDELAAADA